MELILHRIGDEPLLILLNRDLTLTILRDLPIAYNWTGTTPQAGLLGHGAWLRALGHRNRPPGEE